MEKLKTEFKAREDKIMAQEKTLKDKMEKLQRNSAVMSEAEKTKLEREVRTGQGELQRLQTEYREDAAMRQQEEMKKVIDRVNAAIDEVAKKDKFDLIFVREAAPYATQQYDITDKVLKATAPSA
jgi:outer membrane protein